MNDVSREVNFASFVHWELLRKLLRRKWRWKLRFIPSILKEQFEGKGPLYDSLFYTKNDFNTRTSLLFQETSKSEYISSLKREKSKLKRKHEDILQKKSKSKKERLTENKDDIELVTTLMMSLSLWCNHYRSHHEKHQRNVLKEPQDHDDDDSQEQGLIKTMMKRSNRLKSSLFITCCVYFALELQPWFKIK